MPNIEPVVIAGDKYSIRHVGPKASVWPNSPNAPVAVLGNATMVARPLPMSNVPSSPDLVSGSWTGRLGDNGECALVFPNREASDGVPWRQRFDPTGHLQFVEIYFNGELDSVCVIDQIPTIDMQQVAIHGSDGWWLLKKAYERDWIVTQAPRDVIERGTQVWIPLEVDNFPASSTIVGNTLTTPYSTWTLAQPAHVFVGTSGGVQIIGGSTGVGTSATTTNYGNAANGAWRCFASFINVTLASNNSLSTLVLACAESASGTYTVTLSSNGTVASASFNGVSTSAIPPAPSYTLMLESDGEFVTAFVNGAMIGCVRRTAATTTGLQTTITVTKNGALALAQATLSNFLAEMCQPFLMAGTDKGDYVLPGTASTYPSGGLRVQYFNDLDLQGLLASAPATYINTILTPIRTQEYGSSNPAEYVDQQDAQINGQSPAAGASTSNWSCRWSGAIYLKLSAGNYGLRLTMPASATSGVAARVWIGKTQLGADLLSGSGWSLSSGTATFNFTLTASALAGALPAGGGTVQRDGWYPIKVEFACGATAQVAPTLSVTSAPATYTDPGGTAWTPTTVGGVAMPQPIPASSLSPLGCVSQRYQGVAHYDLIQQTAVAYGYQLAVEPKQLESGLFPGVLAPRILEGQSTDIILEPDTGPRQDGEGILNYSSGLDASDFASSLMGNGAGFQNGNTGQLQGIVFDPATMKAALFDAQQWQDFSDASYGSLLEALLNSQLGLQLTPWQLLSADPVGRPRKAYTWPLPGTISSMHWRPGDGLRIHARDINVWDATPRQMLTITRNMLPLGISGTQATFALRPITEARALKQQLFKATRWARNYQGQMVTLMGTIPQSTITAGSLDTNASGVALLPSDQVVGARVVINFNNAAQALNLVINGTDQTSALNGPWTKTPVNLPIRGFAVTSATNNLYAQIKNVGASTTIVQYQLFVDVVR